MSLSTSTRPGPAALATGLFAFAAIGLSACTVLFELWGRSRALALGGAVVTFALLGTLASAMYRDRARIGRPARWCIALAAVVGLACGGVLAERQVATARAATLHYSDGTTHEGTPRTITAWGWTTPAYGLHPAFPGTRVAFGLDAHFNHAPPKVKVSFAKPESALLMPDGVPRRSDGIRIRVAMVAPDGSVSPEQVVDLAQARFLERRWIHHEFASDEGIASLRIAVDAGPPGANTFNDATLVALKATPWTLHVARAGKAVLVAIALAVFAWWLTAWVDAASRGEATVLRDLRVGRGALAIAAGTIVLVGTWSVLASDVVLYWDSRNFWQKTEVLHDLMTTGAWKAFVAVVADFATQDYSMFAAIVPAAVAALFPQGPTRVVFGMTLLVVYAVPAYLATAWLGSRFASVRGGAPPTPTAWLLASVAVFVTVPLPFTRVLLLVPDIGGVVLVVLAWSAAAAMLRACIEAGDASPVRASALLGVTCAVMFLFRRWYVFAAVGFGLVAAALLLAEFVRTPAGRGALARRTTLAAAIAAAAAFPLLCWVVLAWSQSPSSHDYATLYASYRGHWWGQLVQIRRGFGAVALVLAITGLALAWPRERGDLRRRWWLLVAGTVVAFGGFLYVQTPGPHHYNLLVPCIGGAVAVCALRLSSRFGLRALVAFVVCMVAGNIVATRAPADSGWRVLFPGYDLWMPRRMPALASYRELATWLTAPERQDRTLCVVASSSPLNQGVVGELWQLMPGMPRNTLNRRIVSLPQVDSRDGPPQGVERCDIALVGEPFQSHLAPSQQDNIRVLHDALVAGDGPGAAFKAGRGFEMANGARLVVYERVRPVTAAEVAQLRQRWADGEAAQAAGR